MPAAPRRNIAPLARVVNGATVTVRPGDSLWKLARLHLGKGARWREWLAANPSLVDANRIQPGTSLILPETAGSRRTLPPLKISVQSGDSLSKIAKAQLGRSAHWPCIAEANPHLRDADHIYPGQMLFIPSECRPLP